MHLQTCPRTSSSRSDRTSSATSTLAVDGPAGRLLAVRSGPLHRRVRSGLPFQYHEPRYDADAPGERGRMYIHSLKVRDLRAVASARVELLYPGKVERRSARDIELAPPRL